jgi:hypothetical protein
MKTQHQKTSVFAAFLVLSFFSCQTRDVPVDSKPAGEVAASEAESCFAQTWEQQREQIVAMEWEEQVVVLGQLIQKCGTSEASALKILRKN